MRPLKRFVSLDDLRTMPELVDCQLLARGNRLSVLPLTDDEFDAIVRAGGNRPPRLPESVIYYKFGGPRPPNSQENRDCGA